MQPPKFEPLKPKTVLAVGAHPDDLEFGMSGSVAKWAAHGTDCYYLLLTDGSKGSEDRHISSSDLIKMRRDEQKEAAKILGVKEVFFFDYPDGHLENTQELKRDIVRVVRQVKPDVVMALDPTVVYEVNYGYINHPDHRAGAQAVLDAVFPLARDHLTFPELLAEGYEPHKTPHLLMVNFEKFNYFEDITDSLETKLRALGSHKSQGADIPGTQKMMRDMAAMLGKEAGFAQAEGFIRIDISRGTPEDE